MEKLNILIAFILINIFLACGQATNTEIQNGWKLLSEKNYSIQYPENWTLNKSGQMGVSFYLLSPLSSKSDRFKENVNLVIEDLTGHNLSLDNYVDISKNQIKTMITEGNIVLSERIKNNKLEHHKIIYTGKQGVYDLKFEQYFWVENDKAYILTLTSEEASYKSFKTIGESILNSFNIN